MRNDTMEFIKDAHIPISEGHDMKDRDSTSGYRASEDDGRGAFRGFCARHPVLSVLGVVAILCIFGGTIWGFALYVLFVMAAIVFSAIAAFIIYGIVGSLYDHFRKTNGADGGDAAGSGARGGRSVRRKAKNLEVPDELSDLVCKDGVPEALSIARDYTNLLRTADDVGENRDRVIASYRMTMSNAARIISTYRDMQSHPDDFNDIDTVKHEYDETLVSLHRRMMADIKSLNEKKMDGIRADMKSVKDSTADPDGM